jgi:hypothetical protein
MNNRMCLAAATLLASLALETSTPSASAGA